MPSTIINIKLIFKYNAVLLLYALLLMLKRITNEEFEKRVTRPNLSSLLTFLI